MKQSKFKAPNALIQDTRLSYSARRLGCVFFSFSNPMGICRKSYDRLATLAQCSRKTVIRGVKQLVKYGYISFHNTYHYDQKAGRAVYGKNCYCINAELLREGYTLISRDVFRYTLSDAFFTIFMAIFTCFGNSKRAWPSISMLEKMTGAARSTVCAGLLLLKELPILLVQHCLKKTRQFTSNSYILVQDSSANGTTAPSENPKPEQDLPNCLDHSTVPTPCKAFQNLFSTAKRLFSSFSNLVVRFLHNKVRT